MISHRINQSLAKRYGGKPAESFVKKAFDFQVDEALQEIPSGSIEADCSVVYSDISNFASRVSVLLPSQIKDFLDSYYAVILPIIYQHDGLVDQMFGDGIIAVFSSALSPDIDEGVFEAGLKAAEQIVETFAGSTEYSTKCALHKDHAVICQVGDDNYHQATIVGNIMTAVHRVESVATDEAVSMLLSIPEAKAMYEHVQRMTLARRLLDQSVHVDWELSVLEKELKGFRKPQRILVQELIL